MAPHEVPQPSIERMVPFDGRPVVVGVVPHQDPLVLRTAESLARTLGSPALHLAYADVSRYVVEEHPDGSVVHAPMSPDSLDGDWTRTRDGLEAWAQDQLGSDGVPWYFHYLAGRPDRALTHLARAVDACVLVVGTRTSGRGAQLREFVTGSVSTHLAHHQHRPVLTVPLGVVDWKDLEGPWQA
ncbi:universal stress protein [Actinomyces provencensis]|uniref:universal stress protein n=1 Tax=Actinomyces provencensis TaxID=1720198 RepID=UPI00096A2FD4|nr:universal stress protein [Actinomyces provencensis]